MEKKTSQIQVFDRMVWLLDAIAECAEPTSLKILSAETGLHPSTAFRLLNSLSEQGFVVREGNGQYSLGTKLLQLGRHVRSGIDMRLEAKPLLKALRDELNESVNLTVREGNEVVYVERAISKRMMRVEQVIGSRAPLHVTAVGKLMLGSDGESACRKYATEAGLPAFTEHTITSIDKLIDEARASYLRGYGLDNEEAENGVGCIGVLIHNNNGQVVGGLSVSAPIDRRRDEWIERIIETGKELSKRLGYRQRF